MLSPYLNICKQKHHVTLAMIPPQIQRTGAFLAGSSTNASKRALKLRPWLNIDEFNSNREE